MDIRREDNIRSALSSPGYHHLCPPRGGVDYNNTPLPPSGGGGGGHSSSSSSSLSSPPSQDIIWDMDSQSVKTYSSHPPALVNATQSALNYASAAPFYDVGGLPAGGPLGGGGYISSSTTSSTSYPPYDPDWVQVPPPSSASSNNNSGVHKRPKSYQCEHCDKWFTSSGHLKRHYNTTLHRNALRKGGGSSYGPSSSPANVIEDYSPHPDYSPLSNNNNNNISNSGHHHSSSSCVAPSTSVYSTQQHVQQQQQQPTPPSPYGGAYLYYGLSPLSSTAHEGCVVGDEPPGEFRCSECNKTFTKLSYLKQHNKSFHNGEKPYKCSQCGKRFPVDVLYQEHLAKHAGDKPYKCEVCPKQFNHKTDLRRHMCLHTGEKPFSCEVCGKGFIREDRMIKHSETHKKKALAGPNAALV